MNFNQWRENYDNLTFKEQQDYHDYLESLYPDQAHYDLQSALKVIKQTNPFCIIEAGAWKGNLASIVLESNPQILRWHALELCPAAINKTVCKDERFGYFPLDSFDWWNRLYLDDDLFIATHFIEHLSNHHFEEMASKINCDHIYFEAPITEQGNAWDNYHGTHKLTYGWAKITEILKRHGYKRQDITGHCKLFSI